MAKTCDFLSTGDTVKTKDVAARMAVLKDKLQVNWQNPRKNPADSRNQDLRLVKWIPEGTKEQGASGTAYTGPGWYAEFDDTPS